MWNALSKVASMSTTAASDACATEENLKSFSFWSETSQHIIEYIQHKLEYHFVHKSDKIFRQVSGYQLKNHDKKSELKIGIYLWWMCIEVKKCYLKLDRFNQPVYLWKMERYCKFMKTLIYPMTWTSPGILFSYNS